MFVTQTISNSTQLSDLKCNPNLSAEEGDGKCERVSERKHTEVSGRSRLEVSHGLKLKTVSRHSVVTGKQLCQPSAHTTFRATHKL